MIKVSISEAKNRLSALLDKVRHGQSILIMDRSRPVARLDPVETQDVGDLEVWLAELERDGIVRRPKVAPSRLKLTQPIVKPKRQASVVEALLAEREESR